MKAFNGKVIKLYLNSSSGYLVVTGKYIDQDGDYLVIENELNKKIQYFSKYCIKYIEIIKDIEVEDDEYNK